MNTVIQLCLLSRVFVHHPAALSENEFTSQTRQAKTNDKLTSKQASEQASKAASKQANSNCMTVRNAKQNEKHMKRNSIDSGSLEALLGANDHTDYLEHKQTNKQANKQTSKQTNKQTI